MRGLRVLLALLMAIGAICSVGPALRWLYPLRYVEPAIRYAEAHRLDPLLLIAVMRVESRFDPNARSSEGAVGLMQLMPQTASWVAAQMRLPHFEKASLLDPETNMAIGAWYLAALYDEFDQDPVLALAAYNGGIGNVRRWLAERRWSGERESLHQIPFAETRAYVRKVLDVYAIYRWLYADRFGSAHTGSD
ncbi:MAG TPA: lytic transglycosylase domain-containing protein [Limnochordia bacterium]